MLTLRRAAPLASPTTSGRCRIFLVAVLLGVTGAAEYASAQGQFPAWPVTGDTATGTGGVVVTYTRIDEPSSQTFDVTCNGVDIGTIDVMYGLMGRTSNGVFSQGAYIRFGFNRNSNDCCPEPQYEDPTATFRWLQVVTTTDPRGPGQLPGIPFLDHGPNQTNPWYSNNDQGRWGYTTASDDLPTRRPPTGPFNTTWEATTTLVCQGSGAIHTLFSFHWGFTLAPDGTMNRMDPAAVADPINTLQTAMANDPAAAGYAAPEEGCCCIPAPGTGAVFLSACTIFTRRRRTG